MANNKVQDLFNVNGLVAVITGGGTGLGLYAARALDANGAKAVYIVGRREQTLQEAAKTGVNGSIRPIVGDVSDKASLVKVVERIKEEQGYINLLFANAGIIGPQDAAAIKQKSTGDRPSLKEFQAALWQADQDDHNKTLQVNCAGVYHTAIAFLDLLDAGNTKRNVSQDSQILVTSSLAGFNRNLTSGFAYSTSKAAVNHLVKMLSTALAVNGFHIRCNIVAPGLYPSEMNQGVLSQTEKFAGSENHRDAFSDAYIVSREYAPAERTGSESDFAGVILFMASQAGAYLNGETMISDGGRLSQMPATY